MKCYESSTRCEGQFMELKPIIGLIKEEIRTNRKEAMDSIRKDEVSRLKKQNKTPGLAN